MPEKYTIEDVKVFSQKYRNWGKWGPNDQLGTLNYITPEKVVEAAKLVKQGKAFSLAIPFDDKGPQTGAFGRLYHFSWGVTKNEPPERTEKAEGCLANTPPALGAA